MMGLHALSGIGKPPFGEGRGAHVAVDGASSHRFCKTR
jgi:hypothetical protein